jgi:hypothetical protein
MLKIANPFWRCLMEAWIGYSVACTTELTVQDVLMLPIWNTYFTANHNLFKIGKRLCKMGCAKIRDLINVGTMKMYEHDAFVKKYNYNINYLDFASLKKSIPIHYKALLNKLSKNDMSSNPDVYYREHIVKLLAAKKTCNMVYWILVEAGLEYPQCTEKWSREIIHSSEEGIWKQYFMLPMNVCLDTKLRMFQWNILHRVLVTNKKLAMYGILNTNVCTFCQCHEETLLHLFYECKFVKNLWKELFQCLHPNILMQKELDPKEILFGILGFGDNQLINLIVILCKRFIYVNRCFKHTPTISKLILFLKDYYQRESAICKQNGNNAVKIEKKWSVLLCKLR